MGGVAHLERGGPGIFMFHEVNPQHLPLDDLAQRCAQETESYFNYASHDTKYCFELFRRAISERDDPAWKAIMVQYKPSVARWVNKWVDKHPDFPLANEDAQDFIAEAFERFWRFFTPEKFGKSQSLGAVLSYLQMCVNGAILDSWRKMRRRQFDQELDSKNEDEEQVSPEPEPTPEEILQINEIWRFIRKRLNDEKAYIVAYASLSLDLSPRAILADYPGVFRDIKEIYQYKANVLDRLKNDPEIRKLLKGDD